MDTLPQTSNVYCLPGKAGGPPGVASSSDIGGLRLGIRAIWSRIPGLDELYRATYDEPALTESFDLSQTESRSVWDWELRIDDPTPFSNRSELTAIVASLRKRFPALAKWRLVSASQRWDASLIMFGNIPVPENEFAESVLSFCTHENAFAVTGVMEDAPRTPLEDILSPPGGSFSRGGRHSLIKSGRRGLCLRVRSPLSRDVLVIVPGSLQASGMGSRNNPERDAREPSR